MYKTCNAIYAKEPLLTILETQEYHVDLKANRVQTIREHYTMPFAWLSLLGLASTVLLLVCTLIQPTESTGSATYEATGPATVRRNDVFTSSFLVRFHRSVDANEAHRVAIRNGFDSLGPVSICLLSIILIQPPIMGSCVFRNYIKFKRQINALWSFMLT